MAWVPPVPGEYKVHVKLSGKPVKGSPFIVVVAGVSQKRAYLSVGSTSEVFFSYSSVLCSKIKIINVFAKLIENFPK